MYLRILYNRDLMSVKRRVKPAAFGAASKTLPWGDGLHEEMNGISSLS
jgi:hypothetical protein